MGNVQVEHIAISSGTQDDWLPGPRKAALSPFISEVTYT